MMSRRDVLTGVGTGLGVAALSVFAFARRADSLGPGYEFGEIGESLAGSDVPCTAGALTSSEPEGPFYTPSAPKRRDIRDPGVNECVLVLTGRVLDTQCRPLVGAVLDFWQTDHNGVYDNHGYRYRGHQYTDGDGRFELVTVLPQAYTAISIFRTAHIHVKVQGPNTALLTTQLYLPDAEETNARDIGYQPSLALSYTAQNVASRRATFDFFLARG
jgi:protocatechuate 3,4-dioxygenase beta subunit